MPILLVIPGADDMRPAIAASNKYLVYRREGFGGEPNEDRGLGVWLRDELGEDLPRMSCRDLV